MRWPFAALFIAVAACQSVAADDGYGTADTVWILTEIDGAPYNATAKLTFPEPGRIAGRAPCNRFFGPMDAPYPQFKATQLAATKAACPDLPAEDAFFAALSNMEVAERRGDTLILTAPDKRTMTFTRSD